MCNWMCTMIKSKVSDWHTEKNGNRVSMYQKVCRLPSVASRLLPLPCCLSSHLLVRLRCVCLRCVPLMYPVRLRCGCAQVWNADRDRTGRELSEIQDNGDFEEGRLRYKLFEDLYRSFILDVVAPGYSPSLCSLCCSLCCSYVAL